MPTRWCARLNALLSWRWQHSRLPQRQALLKIRRRTKSKKEEHVRLSSFSSRRRWPGPWRAEILCKTDSHYRPKTLDLIWITFSSSPSLTCLCEWDSWTSGNNFSQNVRTSNLPSSHSLLLARFADSSIPGSWQPAQRAFNSDIMKS